MGSQAEPGNQNVGGDTTYLVVRDGYIYLMSDIIESPALKNYRLRVEFVRRGDRYGHIVQIAAGDTVRPLFATVEGTPANPWPPNPVLQNLLIEDRESSTIGARRVGLLVGMAGSSHWSLSVEPDETVAAFVFDAACRVAATELSNLQSTYHPFLTARLVDERRYELVVDDTWLIRFSPYSPPGAKFESVELGLQISPTDVATGKATRRWKYRVEMLPLSA